MSFETITITRSLPVVNGFIIAPQALEKDRGGQGYGVDTAIPVKDFIAAMGSEIGNTTLLSGTGPARLAGGKHGVQEMITFSPVTVDCCTTDEEVTQTYTPPVGDNYFDRGGFTPQAIPEVIMSLAPMTLSGEMSLPPAEDAGITLTVTEASVIVTDSSGSSGSSGSSAKSGLQATDGVEGGIIHLAARYGDPGVLDTHTLSVDWGDNNQESVLVSGGSFDITHSYLDNGVYTISVVLTDKDGGSTEAATTTTIENAAPTIF